jgi:hypothetical protein
MMMLCGLNYGANREWLAGRPEFKVLRNYYNVVAKLETLSCNAYHWPRLRFLIQLQFNVGKSTAQTDY